MTMTTRDVDGTLGGGNGDCFVVALQVIQHSDDVARSIGLLVPRHAYLVHGVPLGTGGEVQGERYWHGWVEFGAPGDRGIVVDWSNGKRYVLDRDNFYTAGSIDPARLLRYTRRDARYWSRRTGMCGPWEPRP